MSFSLSFRYAMLSLSELFEREHYAPERNDVAWPPEVSQPGPNEKGQPIKPPSLISFLMKSVAGRNLDAVAFLQDRVWNFAGLNLSQVKLFRDQPAISALP